MSESKRQRVALFTILNKRPEDVVIAQRLVALGWKIVGSAGTAKYLNKADPNIKAQNVAELTGRGPIIGHKVVTLSEPVHAGLQATTDEELAELAELGFLVIDLVYVGLYDLLAEIANPERTFESIMGATDQGGVAVLTSAGKGNRIVISDPDDWDDVLEQLEANGDVDEATRKYLVAKAYAAVAAYRLASGRELGDGMFDGMVGHRVAEMLYGENAWMIPAALFSLGTDDPLALPNFETIAGTTSSFNNMVDVERLLQTTTHIAAGFDVNYGEVPCIAVGDKHGNPCGAAVADTPEEAVEKMVMGDPRAIFGGLVMVNFPVTLEIAQLLHNMGPGKYDGVVAPSFTDEAIKELSRVKDKCRFIANPALANLSAASLDTVRRIRPVRGGFLVQPNYTFILDLSADNVKVFGKRDEDAERDLILGWAIAATSNSNTITLTKDGQLIGNGVAQQDRVGAAELAVKRSRDSRHDTMGSSGFSDSFVPFVDAIAVLIAAGVKVIFSTSGSIADKQVQALCEAAGVVLYQLPDKEARSFSCH